ncbi:virulence associated protein, partial [Shigella flexneri]|nr:virulence associated protein [Shigella flexneri]
NPIDRPYNEISGAVALFSSNLVDPTAISKTSTNNHPNHNNLKLVVIHGKDMMNLVHELYRRAADEA